MIHKIIKSENVFIMLVLLSAYYYIFNILKMAENRNMKDFIIECENNSVLIPQKEDVSFKRESEPVISKNQSECSENDDTQIFSVNQSYGKPKPINESEIKQFIKLKKLSDHEAMFYQNK